jgi:hypothetical protein
MFYGMESSLAVHELMLFVTADIIFTDYIVAAFVTFIVSCVSEQFIEDPNVANLNLRL